MQGFDGQVAGHGSLFNGTQKGTLLKVFDSREFLFYYNTAKTDNPFKGITCTFHGLVELKDDALENADIDAVAKSYSSYWDKPAVRVPNMFIVIDDLTAGMTKPCMMDVKLGRREHDPWTNDKKREYLMSKCIESTSDKYALRYCGKIVWELVDNTNSNVQEYRQVKSSKLEGRTTDIEVVSRDITGFFDFARDKKKETMAKMVEGLKAMKHAFQEQDLYIIYSSSVLFVYDAVDPTKCAVKLIDLAHAVDKTLITDSNEKGVDKDLIDGVTNLINILEKGME